MMSNKSHPLLYKNHIQHLVVTKHQRLPESRKKNSSWKLLWNFINFSPIETEHKFKFCGVFVHFTTPYLDLIQKIITLTRHFDITTLSCFVERKVFTFFFQRYRLISFIYWISSHSLDLKRFHFFPLLLILLLYFERIFINFLQEVCCKRFNSTPVGWNIN